MSKLVIVESPAKSKTIEKYLGKEYKVVASVGHIRDLPKNKTGIDVDNGYEMEYIIPPDYKKKVTNLRKAAKGATEIILATDLDREGEAIAWHVLEVLKPNKSVPISRIVFNSVTKDEILKAIKDPKKLDMDLVNAQQARRAIDKLVGYNLSPVLWQKVKRGLSAGRVQSVALKFVVDKEKEILAFKPEEYWKVIANFTEDNQKFIAELTKEDKKKIKLDNETKVKEVVTELEKNKYVVGKIDRKEVKKSPPPPFTTSSLQQDASSRLGYSPKKTMMHAQKLYEAGHITYMRTDALNMSSAAIAQASDAVKAEFGAEYVLSKPRYYSKGKTKVKAQEAHEAIRPTDFSVKPRDIEDKLDPQQFKVYRLIYSRALATQMAEARFDTTNIHINNSKYTFNSKGRIMLFDGYLAIYSNIKSDDQTLPELKADQELNMTKLDTSQHFTSPPSRYSEATLIKKLEAEGVGRPSTYASIISTIQDRAYVNLEEKKLLPTVIGITVSDFLVKNFGFVVEPSFTSEVEADLDAVADGDQLWTKVIDKIFLPLRKEIDEKLDSIERAEIPSKKLDKQCPQCKSDMVLKTGKFGEFEACSNYPDCKYIPVTESVETCDNCSKNLIEKTGRYGKFLACPGYPACKFIKKFDNKVEGAVCPECKGSINEKKTKKGRTFFGCSNYPKCEYASWKKEDLVLESATDEKKVSKKKKAKKK